MFFANSRSRFKSKPPKILLAYCLKSICLIVFLILLIVQLRAIAATNRPHTLPSTEFAVTTNQHLNERATTTSISTTTTIRPIEHDTADSIDRHDGESSTSLVPEAPTPPTQPTLNVSFNRDGAANNQLFDDLSVSPATEQTAIHQMASSAGDDQYDGQLSLASSAPLPLVHQLTAASSTPTGPLLMSDLLAQANDMDDQLVYGRGASTSGDPEDTPDSEHNGGGGGGGGPKVIPFYSSPPMLQSSSQVVDSNQLEGDDENNNQQAILFQPETQMLKAHAAQQMNSRSQSSNSELDSATEPSSEEAAPDSIESLMGAEGADLNQDDAQQATAAEDDQHQSLPVNGNAGNLVAPNEADVESQAQLVPQAQQFVAASRSSSPNDDDDENLDGDDDDATNNDDNTGSSAQGSHLQVDHIRRNGYGGAPVPVVMSTRYHSPYDSGHQHQSIGNLVGMSKYGGQLEHNLVAPMRESLSDLNAAAGHYSYGKKKKKKVKKVKKKIIIKKKGKKKKKKKKYKKIKIVKIKKQKKKKGKKMKKHHHHHHYPKHHHDHGKYYMYAKVPKKKSWEFGFKKGNKKHWIERHEKGHKNKFKTKVKWYDKKSKGKGVHIWDYNHHDKKKKKHY